MKPKQIVEDRNYKGMYRLEYDDGVVSEEMYNLTRARDILRNYPSYVRDMNASERMEEQARGVAWEAPTLVKM